MANSLIGADKRGGGEDRRNKKHSWNKIEKRGGKNPFKDHSNF